MEGKPEQSKEADQQAKQNKPANKEIEKLKIELEFKKLDFWEKLLAPIIPKISSYFEQRMLKHDTPILKTSIWVFALITILIIVGTFLLVYWGKLEAASFTFVIGAVFGYLLSFTKMFWGKKED